MTAEDTGNVVSFPDMEGIAGDPLTDFAAEQQLVGAFLCDPEAFAAIEGHVFTEDFADSIHRQLFIAANAAHNDGYAFSMKPAVVSLGGDAARVLFADGTTVGKYIARLMANRDPALRLGDLALRIHELADRRDAELEDMKTAPVEPESRFGAIRFLHLDAPGPEYDYLIKGILTRFERSLLFGASQSGKSFLAADMAVSIALGEPFLGCRTRKGLVLYQAGEGSIGLKKRLRAIRKQRGIPADKNLPFVLMTSPVDLYANDADTLSFIKEAEQWADFYKADAGVELELIVIDTLSAATPGANENASEDMSKILARLALIAKRCRCHVALVHHLNAAGSKPRGHSSLFANIENAIEVTLTDRTCEAVAEDGHSIQRHVRLARVAKQKDGESGGEWEFALKQVVLGKDMDGDPITSCVVVGTKDEAEVSMAGADSADKKVTPAGFKLSKQETMFFQCVVDALNEHGIDPPSQLQIPSSVRRVVDYDHVKVLIGKRMLSEEDLKTEEGRKRHAGRVKMAVRRHRETLQNYKIIAVDNPFVWLTGKAVVGFDHLNPKKYEQKDDASLLSDDDLGALL